MAIDFMNLFGGNDTSGLNALLSADQRKLMGRNANLAAAAALLQASGPSRQRVGLGQALGSALQAGQAGYQQAQQGALQNLLMEQKIKEAQQAQDLQKRISGVFTQPQTQLTPEQRALAMPGMQVGPTVQRAEAAEAMPTMTPEQMRAAQYRRAADIYAASGRPEDAARFQDLAEKAAPRAKVVGQPFEVTDASGKPIMVQQFESGDIRTLAGFGPRREVVLQNLGGRTVAINKSDLRGGESFQQTMTPGEVAANRVALGNLAVAQGGLNLRQQEFQRNAFDRVETPEGIMYVPKTPGGVAIPAMGPTGQPIRGVSGGQPTEGQLNAAGYAQRMDLATSIIDRLPAGAAPGAGTRIAEAIPVVGGAIARAGQSPETQMYDQAAQDWIRAKLRKESGAVIGEDEMRQEYATYFPQVGDSDQKIAQKAEARRVATEAMRKSAGKAYTPYVPPAPPAAPTTGGRLEWDEKNRQYRYVPG